jgi:AcrR family transcriptional regulator
MAAAQAKGRQGRRQRRIARRRQEILAAAARVFANKGFAQATTREIADEADLAEGTLYNYFGGKRDILLAIARETETPMMAALQDIEGLDDRTAMITMFERALNISEAQLPFTQTVFSAAWVDDEILQQFVAVWLGRVYQELKAYIAGRSAAGIFRPIDPGLGARLVIGMFSSLIVPAIRGLAPLPSPQERRALSETVVDLLLDGVRLRETPVEPVRDEDALCCDEPGP